MPVLVLDKNTRRAFTCIDVSVSSFLSIAEAKVFDNRVNCIKADDLLLISNRPIPAPCAGPIANAIAQRRASALTELHAYAYNERTNRTTIPLFTTHCGSTSRGTAMKTLSIIRHAKAETASLTAADFHRPLTKRGAKDARRIGRLLAQVQPAVDWIIASPAARTRTTTAAIAEVVDYSGTLHWEENAYLADAETWLRLLQAVPPEIEHVVVVGHNPGMADLVAGLTSGVPSRLNLHFPTAAVAHLQIEIFWWNQIRWGCGQLRMLVTPKYLGKK